MGSDLGLWTFVGIVLPLTSGTELLLMGFVLTDFNLGGGLAEARRQVTPWLSAAPSFLVAQRPVPGGTAHEWRYRFDITLHGDAGPVRLAWRALIERRYFDVDLDEGRSTSTALTMLRNRIRVDIPLGKLRARLTPFITAEEFQDLSAGVAVQAWLTIGLSIDAGRSLRLEPYYLRRIVRGIPDGNALVFSLYWRP